MPYITAEKTLIRIRDKVPLPIHQVEENLANLGSTLIIPSLTPAKETLTLSMYSINLTRIFTRLKLVIQCFIVSPQPQSFPNQEQLQGFPLLRFHLFQNIL